MRWPRSTPCKPQWPPAVSPVRRTPDYSGLPAAEKIKLGLQHLPD